MQIIRTFISSTFLEFEEERKFIHKELIDNLNKSLHRHNLKIELMDMMYGANEDISNKNVTLDVCLNEIERCQQSINYPYFIALIGWRYGTILPPKKINQNIFSILIQHCNSNDKTYLQKYYRQDMNDINEDFFLINKISFSQREFIVELLINIVMKNQKNLKLQSFYENELISISEKEIKHIQQYPKGGCLFFFKSQSIADIGNKYYQEKQKQLRSQIKEEYDQNVYEYTNINEFKANIEQILIDYILNNTLDDNQYRKKQLYNYVKTLKYKSIFKHSIESNRTRSKFLKLNNNNIICTIIGGRDSNSYDIVYPILNGVFNHYKNIPLSLFLDNSIATIKALLIRILQFIKQMELSYYLYPIDELIDELKNLTEAEIIRIFVKALSSSSSVIIFLDQIDLMTNKDVKKFFAILLSINNKFVKFILTLNSNIDDLYIYQDRILNIKTTHISDIKLNNLQKIEKILKKNERKLVNKELLNYISELNSLDSIFTAHTLVKLLSEIRSYDDISIDNNYFRLFIQTLFRNHGKQIITEIITILELSSQGFTFDELMAFIHNSIEIYEEFSMQYSYSIKLNKVPSVVIRRILLDINDFLEHKLYDQEATMNLHNNIYTQQLVTALNIQSFLKEKIINRIISYYDKQKYSKRYLLMVPLLYKNHGYTSNAIMVINSLEYLKSMLKYYEVEYIIDYYDRYANSLAYPNFIKISHFLLKNSLLLKNNIDSLERLILDNRYNKDDYLKSLIVNSNQTQNLKPILSTQTQYFHSIETSKLFAQQSISVTDNSLSLSFYKENSNFDSYLIVHALYGYIIIRKSSQLFIFKEESKVLIDKFELSNCSIGTMVADNETQKMYFFLRYGKGYIEVEYDCITKLLSSRGEPKPLIELALNRMSSNCKISSTKIQFSNDANYCIEIFNSLSKNEYYFILTNIKDKTNMRMDFEWTIDTVDFSPNSKYFALIEHDNLIIFYTESCSTLCKLRLDTFPSDLKFLNNEILLVGLLDGRIQRVSFYQNSLSITGSEKLSIDFLKLTIYSKDKFLVYSSIQEPIRFYNYNDLFHLDYNTQLLFKRAVDSMIRVNVNEVLLYTTFDPRLILLNITTGEYKTILEVEHEGIGTITFNLEESYLKHHYHDVDNRYGEIEFNTRSTFTVDKSFFYEHHAYPKERRLDFVYEIDEKVFAYPLPNKFIIYALNNVIYLKEDEQIITYHIHDKQITILFYVDDYLVIGDINGLVEVRQFLYQSSSDVKHEFEAIPPCRE